MTLHLHLDAVGGVAGDMFIAAILDAWPDLAHGVDDAIRRAGIGTEVTLELEPWHDDVLTGHRFVVTPAEPTVADADTRPYRPARAGHVHGPGSGHHRHGDGQGHPHGHGSGPGHDQGDHADDHSFAAIRTRLARSDLAPGVRDRAIDIFTLLADAEGRVHGVRPEDVTFHEVGAIDSIADIVGAAYLIDALGAATWTAGALPVGNGRVRTAHGLLPVPAPAVALLLEGFRMVDDGLDGERITPTGAAILRHLGCATARRTGTHRLARSGIGFGQRRIAGLSNCLRLLAFETDEQEATGSVAVIQFEVDDQSGEDLAIGLDHLRAVPGVLDVLQMPAIGKKGRMVAHIQVLARPEAAEQVVVACFEETTTIGLRQQVVGRAELRRRPASAMIQGRELYAKVADRPCSGATAKTEADHVTGVAGHAARERLRHDVAQQVLRQEDPSK